MDDATLDDAERKSIAAKLRQIADDVESGETIFVALLRVNEAGAKNMIVRGIMSKVGMHDVSTFLFKKLHSMAECPLDEEQADEEQIRATLRAAAEAARIPKSKLN